MKKLLFLLSVATLLSACTSTYQFYQVYKVNADKQSTNQSGIVYEDDNCVFTYDLWANGGNTGFDVFNKTKYTIEIDLSNSFFILNGYAKQYYQQRTYVEMTSSAFQRTSSASYGGATSGSGVSKTTSNGYERQEFSVVRIPAGKSVRIEGFNIVSAKWKHCLMGNPFKMKDVVSRTFVESDSPFKFSNILAYSVNGKKVETEHTFYVTSITNYPKRGYLVRKTENECGGALLVPEYRFPKTDPDQFYWSYTVRR